MSGLLFDAFKTRGPGATGRDIATVAAAIRGSGDEEPLAMFRPSGSAYFDHEARDAVIEIAEEAGAGPLVGLDLYTEVIPPGWRRFPRQGAASWTC